MNIGESLLTNFVKASFFAQAGAPTIAAKGIIMSFLSAAFLLVSSLTYADETCMSPYMAKIVGQEDYVYVWTLGVEGLGDEQDKLVTIDVNPSSKTYSKVVSVLSVGGRNEAHHSGFSDDRHYLWAGGLDSNKIFIYNMIKMIIIFIMIVKFYSKLL